MFTISRRILQRKTQIRYSATLKRDIEKGKLYITEILNLFIFLREHLEVLLLAEEIVTFRADDSAEPSNITYMQICWKFEKFKATTTTNTTVLFLLLLLRLQLICSVLKSNICWNIVQEAFKKRQQIKFSIIWCPLPLFKTHKYQDIPPFFSANGDPVPLSLPYLITRNPCY